MVHLFRYLSVGNIIEANAVLGTGRREGAT